jgi:hypothetical protein
MPIQIRYRNDPLHECVIRPTPFISIASEILKTGAGEAFGVTYTISLTGTLLNDQGFPFARNTSSASAGADLYGKAFDFLPLSPAPQPAYLYAGPYEAFDTAHSHAPETDGMNKKPRKQLIDSKYALGALLFKQKVMRALFAIDGQRMEISSVDYNEPAIIVYPRLVDISFDEGPYVDKCEYSITLQADTLLTKDFMVDNDGNPLHAQHRTRDNYDVQGSDTAAHPEAWGFRDQREADILASSGAFVEGFSESWSIEVDDALADMSEMRHKIMKGYRISHQMSATGKTHYGPTRYAGGPSVSEDVHRLPAWKQARDFVQKRLMVPSEGWAAIGGSAPHRHAPNYPNLPYSMGSGCLNLVHAYGGFNHTRTEEIGVDAGSYSVTENWLIASGTAFEQYTMSISSDSSQPFVSVSIDGMVTGLSEIPASGAIYGGTGPVYPESSGAYGNAITKYHLVSNSGKYGLNSNVYKRANNQVAVQLNSQPKSVSLSMDELAGTITYALDFDNRPTNWLSGVLSENIQVQDTYPGDIFAVIPVIGRETGPILQYIGGRTEYKRNLTIDCQLDYTDLPYASGRQSLLYKPSLVEPLRTQLKNLIEDLSPKREPGIRKWFISPAQENWTPKDGSYSISLSWTYELNK